jgi:hypothetical protein
MIVEMLRGGNAGVRIRNCHLQKLPVSKQVQSGDALVRRTAVHAAIPPHKNDAAVDNGSGVDMAREENGRGWILEQIRANNMTYRVRVIFRYLVVDGGPHHRRRCDDRLPRAIRCLPLLLAGRPCSSLFTHYF